MNPVHIATLCTCGIIFSIVIMTFGILHMLRLFIQMTWLHIRVSNRPGNTNVSFEFSNSFMTLASGGFPLGLAMLLVCVKYLPA